MGLKKIMKILSDLRIKRNLELELVCDCAGECGIIKLEHLDILDDDEFSISFYQKKKHKGNSIIVSTENLKEFAETILEFIENKRKENKKE